MREPRKANQVSPTNPFRCSREQTFWRFGDSASFAFRRRSGESIRWHNRPAHRLAHEVPAQARRRLPLPRRPRQAAPLRDPHERPRSDTCDPERVGGLQSNLRTARSRLHRRENMEVNTCVKALDEICKIFILLHRSDLNISEKNRWHFCCQFLENLQNVYFFWPNSLFFA